MRHGRKSKSFNGYKRHIAADIDTRLILSCAVTPANRPEEEAAPELALDIQRQGLSIDQLHIDRGYINASTVPLVLARGGQVLCKPWVARNSHAGLFTKSDFHVDMRRLTITCPAGQTERSTPGATVEFDSETCDRCRIRDNCTMATSAGRTGPHRHPGRGREAATSTPEARGYACRSPEASPARRHRTAPRPHLTAPGTTRALLRSAEPPLRPAPLLRHPKTGDVSPARGRESRIAATFKPFVALGTNDRL